jgi:hypothetical protein
VVDVLASPAERVSGTDEPRITAERRPQMYIGGGVLLLILVILLLILLL